jgi:hypothetical protein
MSTLIRLQLSLVGVEYFAGLPGELTVAVTCRKVQARPALEAGNTASVATFASLGVVD